MIRHSFTNWQAKAGVDVKTVSKILGHADKRTTLSVYRSVTDKMRQEAAKAVEGFAVKPNNEKARTSNKS